MGHIWPVHGCSWNILKPALLPGDNTQDETMDNQLALLLDLSWLAGIIDGEGSLTCGYRNYCESTKFRVYPQVRVGNTNMGIIQSVMRIYDNIGVRYRVETQQYKKHWKELTLIKVNRFVHIINLLTAIQPFLKGKAGQAETMLALCKSRKEQLHRNSPYTIEEIRLMESIAVLNKRGVIDCMPSAAEAA